MEFCHNLCYQRTGYKIWGVKPILDNTAEDGFPMFEIKVI